MAGGRVETLADHSGGDSTVRQLSIIAAAAVFAVVGFVSPILGQQKAATPQRGGVLKILVATGPKVLGWYPEMGPSDATAVYPAIERIMDMSVKREMEPFLAESVKVDQKKLTMTIKLRKGIKFTDGPDMNAEAVAWNYRTVLDPARKVKFALDRPAMAKALGFGYYSPLKMLAPEGEWGYDPAYKGRAYDPDKAKKLLADAGYPDGCKIKLLALTGESQGHNATAPKQSKPISTRRASTSTSMSPMPDGSSAASG